jgi:hypothetical protein
MLARTIFPLLAKTLVSLAPTFTQLGQAFGQTLAAAGPLIAALGQLAGQLLPVLLPLLQPLIGVVTQLTTVLASQLTAALTNLVVPALRTLTALLTGDFAGAWQSLKTLVGGAVTYFTTTLSNLFTTIGTFLTGIVNAFKWLYDTLIGHSIIPDLVNGITAWFGRLPGLVFSALATFASKVTSRATEAGTALVTTITTKLTEAVTWVRGLPGRAYSALSDLGGKLAQRAGDAGTSMVTAVREKVSSAVTAVKEMPGRAASALGGLGGRLVGAGEDLIQGMINGIRNMAGSLVSAAKDVVGGAIEGAKNLLGISSPSKVFAEIGRDTGRGMVVGLNGAQASVNQAASQMAATVAAPFNTVGTGVGISGGGTAASLGVGAVRTTGTTGTTVINNNFYLENRGAIGSQRDMENWLTAALDRLRLQGRLPSRAAA